MGMGQVSQHKKKTPLIQIEKRKKDKKRKVKHDGEVEEDEGSGVIKKYGVGFIHPWFFVFSRFRRIWNRRCLFVLSSKWLVRVGMCVLELMVSLKGRGASIEAPLP